MMLRVSGLPLLPGNTFRDIHQNRFHKSQHFEVNKGECILAERPKPGIGGRPLETQIESRPFSLYPPRYGPKAPSWLANDKKVLCFYGYFKETLHEIAKIPYQVRRVKILFYLEDGSMQVSEPRTLNSGIPQGCLVTRQRIPRYKSRTEFVDILDIEVGEKLILFDRCYFLTGCDKFTRYYLNNAGISVPDNIDAPPDPTEELRIAEKVASLPKQPSVTFDNLAKFLENDRKVLRFSGYWDDRDSEFGDVHHLEILYHLSDDTIEIKWKLPPNSGYNSNGMFLKRGKLPKNLDRLPKPGEVTPFTVLNVLGKGLRGGRYIMDCLDTGSNSIQYYHEKDLGIGVEINVHGRRVHLTSCDEFTQDFYRKKYGIENFTPEYNPAINRTSNEMSDRELPPFNGWGTHEDSEGNCKTVEPRAPNRDFVKFFKYDGYILRFGARLISKIKENNNRAFIILYYLDDDTISVYEIGLKNSGFLGGEFFKRSKMYLPGQEWLSASRPKTYKAEDLFIGTKVNLRDHIFALISADRFSLNFMEQNPHQFIFANITLIMEKIRENMRPIYKDFIAKYLNRVHTEEIAGKNVSLICYEDFKEMILDLLGSNIVEHEIVTLCRHFSAETEVQVPFDKEVIRSAVHAELARSLWNDRSRIREHIYHIAPHHNGFLPQKTMISVIRACKLPFDIALIEKLISVLNKDAEGNIDIDDFEHFLDPIGHPSHPIAPLNVKRDVHQFKPFTVAGKLIDWDAFLEEIDLEQDLKHLTG
uniref:EF-hand domain-containing family member C2 n=1 Tax=Culicoides sonorensis TaxID=179676 RepID=A0A336MSJ8_CULSO